MVQTTRPETDIFNSGGWDNNSKAVTDPLSPFIANDEDADLIKTVHEPFSEIFVTQLSQFVYTQDQDGIWEIKLRARKAATTSVILDLLVELRLFYVDETDQGLLINSVLLENLPDILTDFTIPIPDYSNAWDTLSVRLLAITA